MADLLHWRVTHRFNPDLGPGKIVAVEGRTLVVEFPSAGTVLRLAADSDVLLPVELGPGSRARLEPSGEEVLIESLPETGRARLADGRTVSLEDLWPVDAGEFLFERLATGDVDPLQDFSNRLDALHLTALREADGLGSFLGGRIEIFPHQLYVAERATRSDPVRWLLADEVGLGKTVEACLILNHLTRTGRADRVLVVAPDTLTVQWLGELWRKYHQVFVLLDDKRLVDVEKDYGKGFNPFDAYHRTVVGMQMLLANPWLTDRVEEAGIDLLIVDEAHWLRRPPHRPGNAIYRVIQPMTSVCRHVLLLTATPLEDDAHGFFRLLQLLRPDEFPEEGSFADRLDSGDPLPPCTSSTRRVDIGGLPPRVPRPVEIDDPDGWAALERLEAALLTSAAEGPVARRKKLKRIVRMMSSGAALEPLLERSEKELLELARKAVDVDPRLRWLADRAARWRDRNEKTLVFATHRETLEMLKAVMSLLAQLRVGVFHEDLSTVRRDIEVAQFRLGSGPSMLVSTECGGEGRNFQFCNRIVLFDLPWDPMTLEQRIGRLDRIGRSRPIEIVYFRPPFGLGSAMAGLYEALGIFREPLGGLGRELAGVRALVAEAALSGETSFDAGRFEPVIEKARKARDRIQAAAHHELHREPYRPEMEDSILARIPPDLDDFTEEVVLAACERTGLSAEKQRGRSTYSVEFGNQALVESLPGVPGGSNFLGTFDRLEGVENETIDFFALGHPLVEGLMAHMDEAHHGRVSLLHVRGGGEVGLGVLSIYSDGTDFEAVAVDLNGNERPDWADILTRRPLRSRRVKPEAWTRQPGWPSLIRNLAKKIRRSGRLVAVAAFRTGG